MTDPSWSHEEAVEYVQQRGLAMYLGAYVNRIIKKTGVPQPEPDSTVDMAEVMVEPLNKATETIWRAMMGDPEWERCLDEFKGLLEGL